jgi:predicted enzyme related to lactoylglutathione lyase
MTTTLGVQTILHPVTDLEKAKPVYAALLGVEPMADSPYYVGFEAAGQQIGLVPNSDMTAPVAHWHVTDIEAKLKEIVAAGGTITSEPRDVSEGRLVATVTDPDGNVLGLIQDPS